MDSPEISHLKLSEGFRRRMYKDTTGHNTIGYGFNVDAGISPALAELILREQYSTILTECDFQFPWWSRLCDVRRHVVAEMVFNMGMPTFLGFKKTIAYLAEGDVDAASKEMLRSEWAAQTGERSERLSRMLRTGEWWYETSSD